MFSETLGLGVTGRSSTFAAELSPRVWPKLLAPLLALELGLAAGYLLTQTHVLGEQAALWFDLDREQSVGTWFSSTQLLAIAAVLAMTPTRGRSHGEPSRWFLNAAAGAFVFLSMDETIGVHEAISVAVRQRISILALGWMPIYAVAATACLALAGPQLLRLWRGYPAIVVLAGCGVSVFVGGGLILEWIGFLLQLSRAHFQIVMEEFAEMAGASLILCAVLLLRERLNATARRWG